MMFLFTGGQVVEKGTYWEPDEGVKVMLENSGFLPGGRKKKYFKLPESYLLIPILLFGLTLSMAFPYGVGVVLFGVMYISYMILYSVSDKCQKVLCTLIANIVFEYKPNLSFFLGRAKRKKSRKMKDDKNKE